MEPNKTDDELIAEIFTKVGKKPGDVLDKDSLAKINAALDFSETKYITKPFASAHELGEMVNNLDDPNLIKKNTETDGATRSCLMKLFGFQQQGIGDVFGELANQHMELMVSNARKGRSEKVTMTTGSKALDLQKPQFELFKRAKVEEKAPNQQPNNQGGEK